MRILFCGDLVLKGTSNYEISDSVKNYFNSFDYKIVNFEGPINDPTTKEIKLIKAGPHVCNSEKTLELIKTLGVNVAALSNNHIMDYGENALSYTVSLALYAARNFYQVYRELPGGKGFADLVFVPRKKFADKPALVVELKWDKSAEGAIQQIKKKEYCQSLEEYQGNLLLVAVNYDKTTKEHECRIERYQK